MGNFNIKEDGGIIRLSEKSGGELPKICENIVFISHDARDWQIASFFCDLIKKASFGQLSTFCSSQKGDIKYGQEWYTEIIKKIGISNSIVCLLTKNSIKKPWILFEAGFARGKDSKRNIRGLVFDTNVRHNHPFSIFQQCKCNKENVKELITEIMSEHTIFASDVQSNIDIIKNIEKYTNQFLKNIEQEKSKGKKISIVTK